MNPTAFSESAPATPAPAATPAPVIPKIPDVQIVPARWVDAPSPQPAPLSHAAEMAQKRRELKERVFDFLRSIAVDGVMPTVAEYDERKPADLLDGKNLLNSLGYMSWQDVAHDVSLKWSGKGRMQKPGQHGRKL